MSIAKKRLVSFLERTSHSVKSGSFQNFQLTINQPNTTCSPVTLPKEEVQISSPFRRHIVPYTWVFLLFLFCFGKAAAGTSDSVLCDAPPVLRDARREKQRWIVLGTPEEGCLFQGSLILSVLLAFSKELSSEQYI